MDIQMNNLFAFAVAFFLVGGTLPAADWRPVNAPELAQKTPRVDPAADAEAIFWDIRLKTGLRGAISPLAMNHYIRIKIFTDLGREKYATVEIPRYGKRFISDVAGRTIKPDGTIIDLKKDAIYRELVKTKGLKLQGKTWRLASLLTRWRSSPATARMSAGSGPRLARSTTPFPRSAWGRRPRRLL